MTVRDPTRGRGAFTRALRLTNYGRRLPGDPSSRLAGRAGHDTKLTNSVRETVDRAVDHGWATGSAAQLNDAAGELLDVVASASVYLANPCPPGTGREHRRRRPVLPHRNDWMRTRRSRGLFLQPGC